jgi:hypothetical protein
LAPLGTSSGVGTGCADITSSAFKYGLPPPGVGNGNFDAMGAAVAVSDALIGVASETTAVDEDNNADSMVGPAGSAGLCWNMIRILM